MFLSFDNRLFGGVCGGLAQRSPFNAWVWRAIFVAAALLSGGTLALLYGLWWLILPAESPLQGRGPAWRSALALLLGVGFVGLWVARPSLISPTGQDLFWPVVALGAAVTWLGVQVAQRANVLWGLVWVATAAFWVALSWGAWPAGFGDWAGRAWPMLLLFFGLALLLRARFAWGNWVALILSVALVGGLAAFAISSRQDQSSRAQERSEAVTFAAPSTLLISLNTLDTDVSVFSGEPTSQDVRYRFSGSQASAIRVESGVDAAGIASYRLIEERASAIPTLEELGRGTLVLELPPNIPIALDFTGQRGQSSFDLAALNLERLNVDLNDGDLAFTLPAYQPQSPTVVESPGRLNIFNGDLRLRVPPDIGAQFILNKASNARPLFDDILYALEDNLDEWRLSARNLNSAAIQVRYILAVPRGSIRLDTQE